MEINSDQNDEIYNAFFSEDVEKTLDKIENHPDFSVDSWLFNTMTKVILLYSKYVKDNEVQWQKTVIHVNKLYSREYTLSAIKGGFEDQLFQNRCAPEGFTLEGRGINIITEYQGFLILSRDEHTIYHREDET